LSGWVLTDIGQLVTFADGGPQGHLAEVTDAAVVIDQGVFQWVGPKANLPERYRAWPTRSAGGRAVVPGLVDGHTHLCFGGWRGDEFAERIAGVPYLEIARRGGGIASTVRATRAASEDELTRKAAEALAGMMRLGVTTVEAKSGYGLSLNDELKQLRVYARLRAEQPVHVVSTCLAAHIVPPEFTHRREDWLRLVEEQLYPRVAAEGLASFADVFVEDTAYTQAEGERLMRAAQRCGLGVRVHADQITRSGGSVLAARVGAASADHLEQASDADLAALAEAGVVGGILPLASLYTYETPTNGRRLLDVGVRVMVASDFNPGSAPSYHLPLALMLACTMSRLTPAEALDGATRVAAQSLGLGQTKGQIREGFHADLAVIDAPSVNHWIYHFQGTPTHLTVAGGQVVFER